MFNLALRVTILRVFLFTPTQCLNGGESWAAYHTPFVLSDSGTHVVLFRSTDVAGNDEPVQLVTVRSERLPRLRKRN